MAYMVFVTCIPYLEKMRINKSINETEYTIATYTYFLHVIFGLFYFALIPMGYYYFF